MLECCTGTLRPFQYLVATKTFEARKLGKTRWLSQRLFSVSYKRLKQASYMYVSAFSQCVYSFCRQFHNGHSGIFWPSKQKRGGGTMRQCVSVIIQRGDRLSLVCHLDITLARVFTALAVLDYPFQHSCFLWVSRDHILLSIHPAAAAVWTRCIGPHSFSFQVLDNRFEPSPCFCLLSDLCQPF